MRSLNPIVILCVIVCFLFSQFPQMIHAGDNYATAKKSIKITKTSPQVLKTPEKAMPKDEIKTSTKVLLGLLAAALIAGVAAAALGGGGGGGDDPPDGPDTGSVTVGY